MAAIQEEILDDFLTRLSKSKGIDEELIRALRALFSTDGKLKADDLVAIYEAARKESAV